MPRTTHFLPWDRPLPAQAAAWLAGGRTGRPIDLSDTWVIVPTRQAGRRLREALARHAHAAGTAVLAPRVSLPEGMFDAGRAPNQALPAAVRLHWARTLRGLPVESFADVLPRPPDVRTFSWALGLGDRFAALRSDLAEGGMCIGDVAARGGPDFPEADRWSQLAGLESEFLRRIERAGLTDPDAAKVNFALQPGPPPSEIRRMVLMGCPDPMPLALTVLGAWAESIEVAVVVHAPSAIGAAFDGWGRPVREAWPAAAPQLRDFEDHVHLCADAGEQAGRVAAWAARYGHLDAMLGVGCADDGVVPLVAAALAGAGIRYFDPEGRPLGRGGLARFLTTVRRFATDESYEAAGDLARRPEVLWWLERRLGGSFSPARFLADMDELNAQHLPATMDLAVAAARSDGKRAPGLAAGLELLAELGAAARRATFPRGFLDWLVDVLGATPQDAGPQDRRRIEEAEALRAVVDEIAAADREAGAGADEGWELTLAQMGRARVFGEKEPGAIEILGWLELLWEDAPHIVVAGLNEGCVPESIVSDAFLPGSLRERLGLRSNEDRLARDSYVLAAIAAARGEGGRLDVLLGKRSAAGDPLHPSRLLLACAQEALPGRVRFLFRSPAPVSGTIPWARAWRLSLPEMAPPETIRVTAFRDYLACPFRFSLKHVLGMRAVEPDMREMDALDFGTLVHSVLESLGRDDARRDCTDGEVLAEFFSGELDGLVAARFGASLSVPLVVQVESARQRLRQAAHVQAAARAEGWRIEKTEWAFPADAVVLEGLAVRGKIDRVERHQTTGVVRVLDYKTSDTPDTPAGAHRKKLGRTRVLRFEPAGCEVDGEPAEWTDLQLPLYRLAASGFGDRVECGYFNLPKAVSETAIEVWHGLDGAVQESAVACARGVASAVRARLFWPPAEDVRDDDFTRLFHEGVAASVVRAGAGDGGAG